MAGRGADSNKIDNIIEGLLYLIPVIDKKLMRVNPHRISPHIQLSRLHVMIMGTLERNKKMRASEIGREFMILKPQMTRLIREMVDAGLVEQIPDTTDKRARYIVLTAEGLAALRKFRKVLKKTVAERLSRLSAADVDEFSALLARLHHIGYILEKYLD
jgi:DNA-binding MarR family transcriptional regulator